MSKTLMLMRHGSYGSDSNLDEAGLRQSDSVAEQLVAKGLVPDAIVHSPVKRAAQTALRVKEVFNRLAHKDVPLITEWAFSEDHYLTPLHELMQKLDDKAKTLLVVSHQPNIRGVFTVLAGRWLTDKLPMPGDLFVLEGSGDSWQSLLDQVKFTRRLMPR